MLHEIAETYETGQYVVGHLDISAIAVEENGAKKTNLLHCETPIGGTKVDLISNVERVPYEQKDDRCENIV
jgi:hypothetical protein